MQADSEARIAMLRKKSKKGKSVEEDQAEKALDKQLKGKARAVEDAAQVEESAHNSITTDDGHCELDSMLYGVHAAHILRQSISGRISNEASLLRLVRKVARTKTMKQTGRPSKRSGTHKLLCT
jgi:hypothetical protein